jgi:hypothetical protein
MRSAWIEVAAGPDLETARRNYVTVLETLGLGEVDIPVDDIRIETIHTSAGGRRRILLRRDTAVRLRILSPEDETI